MKRPKRWKLHPQYKQESGELSKHIGCSEILSQLLLNRGIKTVDEANQFLFNHETDIQFDSDHLSRIHDIIFDAIQQKKPILVYGDYDVDGMTSTTMMVRVLTLLGGVVRYKIPHRFNDGYGLNMGIVDLIKKDNVGLLLTLDCGVTHVKEIDAVKSETSASVVVFDHHQLPDKVPSFDAMLNPKTYDETHGVYYLCTAGIVFKFIEYLSTRYDVIKSKQFLDLTALGTVADVVTLKGENRRLVYEGLFELSKRKNKGIQALLQRAGIDKEWLSARDCGFVIAPRLNAAGRLTSAKHGVELLLSQDDQHAKKIANHLESLNLERRALDQSMVKQAVDRVELSDHYKNQSVLVLGDSSWHAGVIGITASKLSEQYSRPVVMMSIGEDIVRGSARSFGQVNVHYLLKQCESYFIAFGGHKEAAGFSLKPENVDAFQQQLESVAKEYINDKDLYGSLDIDMMLPSSELSLELVDELAKCGPFGEGNPEPMFYSKDLGVLDSRTVGDGKHLKLKLVDQKTQKLVDAIGFGLGDKLNLLYKKEHHFVFEVDRNIWNGRESLQLILKDIK